MIRNTRLESIMKDIIPSGPAQTMTMMTVDSIEGGLATITPADAPQMVGIPARLMSSTRPAPGDLALVMKHSDTWYVLDVVSPDEGSSTSTGGVVTAEDVAGIRADVDRLRHVAVGVSADWYSNINDAIVAAGQGGTVRLSPGVAYGPYAAPILLIPGIRIIGPSAEKTSITTSAASGFQVSDKTSLCADVQLEGFRVFPSGTPLRGIDARGLTRSKWRYVDVYGGFSSEAVWWGGDGTYHSSWSNTVEGGQFVAPATGPAMRFAGVNAGGASTANAMSIRNATIFVQDNASSIGVLILEGDTNIFDHCDIGYSGGLNGLSLVLGGGTGFSQLNTFFMIRTEAIPKAAELRNNASYNTFVSSSLNTSSTTVSPVELFSGSEYNHFISNGYAGTAPRPYVKINTGSTNNKVRDKSLDRQNTPDAYAMAGQGDAIIQSQVTGDAHNRFQLLSTGTMYFTSGITGADEGLFMRREPNVIGTGDTSTLQAGNGAWNGGHLRLGGYHLWMDANGVLRVKASAPTGDLDGVVVGIQA